MLACLHEILIVFFLNIHAKFSWKAFLSYFHFMLSQSLLKNHTSGAHAQLLSPLIFLYYIFLITSFWLLLKVRVFLALMVGSTAI